MSSSFKKLNFKEHEDRNTFSNDNESFRIMLDNNPECLINTKKDPSERNPILNNSECNKNILVIDDYKSDMIQSFYKFRNENLFTDVYIYVEGVEFPCHKVVLCAASCYFKAMFSCDLKESRLGKVFIENISPWTMKRLLDFVYTGKIEINYDNVIEVFNAAVMFQLSKLADKCSDYIREHIDLANCIEIHVFSSMHNLEQLESDTFQFILDNFMQLINFRSICINKTTGVQSIHESTCKSSSKSTHITCTNSNLNNMIYFGDFVRLNEQTFLNLISSDSLNVSREIYVYHALKKWMDYKILTRSPEQKIINQKHVYENLFENIRLNALTQNELKYILYNDDMVSSNENLIEKISYHLDSFGNSAFLANNKKNSFANLDNLEDYDTVTSKLNSSSPSTNLNNLVQKSGSANSNDELNQNNINNSKTVKIRPSTIPRDYLCFLKSNQFQYYDFYKSKWNTLASWPKSMKNKANAEECYDFFRDSETRNNTEPPTNIHGYSTCLINNILYIIGGYILRSRSQCVDNSARFNIDENQSIELVDQVWRFDPIKNEWFNCKNMLRKRAFHISVSLKTNIDYKLRSITKQESDKYIFVFYGLCNNEATTCNVVNDQIPGFSLEQCLSVDFYNLKTDQWSKLKNIDSLLDHHIFQSINNQNRYIFNDYRSDNADNSEQSHQSRFNLLNQLIENQFAQSKLLISLRNLIYILKENCIHCYEFDPTLEQLICLPYFRLPANLNTFVLAAAVESDSKPTSVKSLFTWYSDEDNIYSSQEFSKEIGTIYKSSYNNEDEQDNISEKSKGFKEVLIYLFNMEMGVLYQFYPAKNKLKRLSNLLLKHDSNETFLIDMKSKLYMTGGIIQDGNKELRDDTETVENENFQSNAIEEYDEEKENWSILINNVESASFQTSPIFVSRENASNDLIETRILESKRFFRLKMAHVLV